MIFFFLKTQNSLDDFTRKILDNFIKNNLFFIFSLITYFII